MALLAGALAALVSQYVKAGAAAREVLVLQKLLPLADSVAGCYQKLSAKRLTVLPARAPEHGDFARKAIGTVEELRAATGIDLGAVARRLADTGPRTPPSVPPRGT